MNNDYKKTIYKTYNTEEKNFFSTTEIPVFIDDNSGLRLAEFDSVFAFTAECEGEIRIKLLGKKVSEKCKISKYDIYIDGQKIKNEVLNFEKNSKYVVILSNLNRGLHTIKFVKKSGGDIIRIDSVEIYGLMLNPPCLSEENGLYVEVEEPQTGKDYSNFYIYQKTSHYSEKYFIKYQFIYEYNESKSSLNYSNGANDPANRENYRIKEAFIVKKIGENVFEKVCRILQLGEVSMAMREKGAGDFIGGFHGDEHFKSLWLCLDGKKEISLNKATPAFYNCTFVEFKQESVLNRCNTPDINVVKHNQHYLIDTNGIRLNQHLEWLVNDFNINFNDTYLQMFTLYRIDENKNALINKFTRLDENKELLDSTAVMSNYEFGNDEYITTEYNPNARYVEYIGDKGIYAFAGIVKVDDSCGVNNTMVAIRRHGDCKWYPSIAGGKPKPMKGDIWNLSTYSFIDYSPI